MKQNIEQIKADAETNAIYKITDDANTPKDVKKFLTAKTREKDLGVFVEPAAMPLNEFLDRWLSDVAKNKLRARTFENYESLLNSHIRAKLGLKRLSDIQSYEVAETL